MTKITNIGKNPVSVYCGGVSMAIAGGDNIDSPNFTEAEVKFYRAHPEAFSVEGDPIAAGDTEAAVNAALEKVRIAVGAEEGESAMDAVGRMTGFHNSLAPVAERLAVGRDAFVQAITDALDDGEKFRDNLREIVALFGTEEVDELNVKAAVERLLQDAGNKALSDATNDGKGDDGPFEPLTLAAAVASLDDANDDHWTQAGLPDISTLKTLTGADVTRAMVDQLPEGDKRERVK